MAPVGRKLIVITGPTATGKTDLAIEIAQEINGAVISADSRQVYAGMNIGTATPLRSSSFTGQEPHGHLEPDNIKGIPHYLLNIHYPNQPLSLSEWQAMAFEVIDYVCSEGSSPLLVGGTMLYVDSIIKNYDLPQVPPNPVLRAELAAKETGQLYAELLQKDPAAHTFIQPLNKRRIIRALEVIAATGQAFSQQRRQRPPRYTMTAIGLFDTWEALEQRITQRIGKMFDDGLVEETRRLIDAYGPELPLLQTMNYQQVLSVLNGELAEKEAREEMRRANLKYARRQMSWWRGRPDVAWYSPYDRETIKKRLLGD